MVGVGRKQLGGENCEGRRFEDEIEKGDNRWKLQ